MPFVNPNGHGASAVQRIYPPTVRPPKKAGDKPITLRGIEEGDWIDIETDDSSARRQRTMAGAMTAAKNAVGEYVLRADPFAHKMATIRDVVVGWSDGEVTDAALDLLPPEVSDWIFDEWERLAAGRTDDEKNASAGSSSPGRAAPLRASRRNSITSDV